LQQEAQLSLTNRAMLFCKVAEVLQDVLSENVDKKFTLCLVGVDAGNAVITSTGPHNTSSELPFRF